MDRGGAGGASRGTSGRGGTGGRSTATGGASRNGGGGGQTSSATAGSGGSVALDAGSVCSGRAPIDAGTGGSSTSLVAYYPCESATGTTLPDQSGNNNQATLVTGTGGTPGYAFAAGKVNNALDFVKASQGQAILPAGLLATACEATIATWVSQALASGS